MVVRVLRAATVEVSLPEIGAALERVGNTDLFQYLGPARELPERYRVRWRTDRGETREQVDTYASGRKLNEGENRGLTPGSTGTPVVVGTHPVVADGWAGMRFAVWALRPAGQRRRDSIAGTVAATPCAAEAKREYGNFSSPSSVPDTFIV